MMNNTRTVSNLPATEFISTGTTYPDKTHPDIAFDPKCENCALSKGLAVGGAGPENLHEIKLVVISDHPGEYETKCGYPFFDNRPKLEEKKSNVLGWLNAGGFLRSILAELFGLNTYTDCWCTNAVKCSSHHKSKINHAVSPCAASWLRNELSVISCIKPDVPILACGRLALKGLSHIYPTLIKTTINSNRRKVVMLGQHPTVFTYNPAAVCQTLPHVETGIGSKNGRMYVRASKELDFVPGSPLDMYIRDLLCLKPYL